MSLATVWLSQNKNKILPSKKADRHIINVMKPNFGVSNLLNKSDYQVDYNNSVVTGFVKLCKTKMVTHTVESRRLRLLSNSLDQFSFEFSTMSNYSCLFLCWLRGPALSSRSELQQVLDRRKRLASDQEEEGQHRTPLEDVMLRRHQKQLEVIDPVYMLEGFKGFNEDASLIFSFQQIIIASIN